MHLIRFIKLSPVPPIKLIKLDEFNDVKKAYMVHVMD